MKINAKKLLKFLKSENCEPIFQDNSQFDPNNYCGWLLAGNLEIYDNYCEDSEYPKKTLEQSANFNNKVSVDILENGKARKAKSLADIIANFKINN